MKKLLIWFMAVAGLSACGPHMYTTYSSGKENASYIIVVGNQSYTNVSVVVDGKSFQIDKVYQLKATRKANPVITSPGKHQITVVANGKTVLTENVFLGLQETKKIVLE